jgi:signal transduction histidine kinase
VNPQRANETIGLLAGFLSPAHLLDAMAGARDGAADAVDVEVVADGAGTILSDRRGSDGEMLHASAQVGTLAPGVDGPRITVQVREPAAVAFRSAVALRQTLARIALAVLVLSVALGGLVAWRISQPIRRLTGAARAIAARGRPEPLVALPEAGGEVGVLSSAFETMLERLAAAQREAIHQSRLALLGEVAASIAHDVRTPLSVLKTSAQLLANGEVAAAERHELGTMVALEVDRLNRVVSRLVDLARPQRPRVAPEPLAGLVDEAIALLRPWARERGIELETRPGAPALRVRVDRDHIEQVVLNLLHNAVQAARTRVVLGWTAEPTTALVEVTDDGAGFTDEALARAFSPFFTTKAEGTGLGLAITKRLVEEQGGQVGAENQASGGARVWLRLPLAMEVA